MCKTCWDPTSNRPLSAWLRALRRSLLAVLGEADWAGNEDALYFPGFRHLETLSKTASSTPVMHLKGQAALCKEALRGKGTSFVSLIKLVLIAVHSTYFH